MVEQNVVKNWLHNVTQILKDTAKIIKQDAIYGTRLGQAKIKEMHFEQKKVQKLVEIGRRTFFLYKKGLITDNQLKYLCNQMFMLEKTSAAYHKMSIDYKKRIKL